MNAASCTVQEKIWKLQNASANRKNGSKTLAKLTAIVGNASDGSVHWEGLFRNFLDDSPRK